ncbi:cell wall-active antibiotics response protein LiaF [Salibacterium aidingense]|uniref:cell wall-active antibiotics response protein LiaF n=1 Tax=Salibacterium aidingense TaxID=384933 RepID=UPI000407D5E0|nr:cell wall-active antibiotics response protein LiaF [Salibacterium aidingense]
MLRNSGNLILGFIIVVIGLHLLFNQFDTSFHVNLAAYIWPLIAFSISYHFYNKGRKWLALLFLAFAVISLGNHLFHVDLTGVFIALVLLYFGFKLMKGNSKEIDIDKDLPPKEEKENRSSVDQTPDLQQEQGDTQEETPHVTEAVPARRSNRKSRQNTDERSSEPIVTPSHKNVFIGDFKLMKRRFALQDMNVKYGMGDIAIDFSKAIIDEGETVIVLQGGIGDVDLYIPYDLNVSIQASAALGDINILEHREEGLNKEAIVQTDYYKEAPRKVKILISVILGDIDVRYV